MFGIKKVHCCVTSGLKSDLCRSQFLKEPHTWQIDQLNQKPKIALEVSKTWSDLTAIHRGRCLLKTESRHTDHFKVCSFQNLSHQNRILLTPRPRFLAILLLGRVLHVTTELPLYVVITYTLYSSWRSPLKDRVVWSLMLIMYEVHSKSSRTGRISQKVDVLSF